jgi:hypothetical protein
MKYIILVSAFFMLVFTAQAQESKWQIRADYYKPKGVISLNNVTVNGFHFPNSWGVSVGAERDWKRGERSRLYQSFTAGYYNDVYFERVATLETGLGYNRRLYKGLFLGGEFNIGYNRAVSSHLISVYEGEKWVSKVDNSEVVNRFAGTLGLQLGYDLGQHFEGKLPLSIVAGLNAQVLTPFIPGSGVNIFGYTQRRFGVKWRF